MVAGSEKASPPARYHPAPQSGRAAGAGEHDPRRVRRGSASIPRPVIAAIRGYALGRRLRARAHVRPARGRRARLGWPTRNPARCSSPAPAGPNGSPAHRAGADEEIRVERPAGPRRRSAPLGILDRVVRCDEVEKNALRWAAKLGEGAVVRDGTRRRPRRRHRRPLAEGLEPRPTRSEAFGTDDGRLGVESFLEHGPGKAKFSGRLTRSQAMPRRTPGPPAEPRTSPSAIT